MSVSENSPTVFSAPDNPDLFDGVTVFLEVVRTGGFARAAEELGLTRSAVGKAVARLEGRLGTRLFHRTTRAHSLTEDGQIYHERCLRALHELQSAQAQMESGRSTAAGRLRVTMPVLFGRYCAAPILLQLAREHPELELHLNFTDRHVDLAAEGFDLAIRMGALGAESEGLRARKLVAFHKVVCAAPAYLAAHGKPQTLADLSHHTLLHYRHADRVHVWKLLDASGRTAPVALHSRFLLDDLEVIADAAEQGMGLAWLPEWLVRARLDRGVLTEVLADIAGEVMTSYALWPSAQHTSLRVRLAVDALVEKLPQSGIFAEKASFAEPDRHEASMR